MAIYMLQRLEGGGMSKAALVIAKETDLDLECHLEDWLENSPAALIYNEQILWIDRQSSAKDELGNIYPDLLGVDYQGNLIIVELKKGRTPRDIIAQLLEYAAWADELSESQIHEIAEAYFDTRDELQGKTFDSAFKTLYDVPESDELPPLNRNLRLFIVAEEISSRVVRVCRFLRTSHGMDVRCIAVSTFKTESGEELVSAETKVGDDVIAIPKTQLQRAAHASRWTGDKPVAQVVWEAVMEITSGDVDIEFAIKDLKPVILGKYPDFNMNNLGPEIASGCVNHPSRKHHKGDKDRYLRIDTGRYRLYDRENDKKKEGPMS